MLSRPALSPVGKNADVAVPFTDLSFQWRQIEAQVLPDIHRLFEQSAFCLGPFVERFEEAAADYRVLRMRSASTPARLLCILP
jgi:hypothetical protein